jgi:5-(carboxyamino)imidazole ribonucleotide synthase
LAIFLTTSTSVFFAGYPLGHQFGFSGNSQNEPSSLLGHLFINDNKSLVDFADVITFESENTDVEVVKKIAKLSFR